MITDFSKSHANIISRLMKFGGLPALLAQPAAARMLASEFVQFFREAVFGHHTEEERDLFPMILARTLHGAELELVRSTVERLTQEHRQVEAKWAKLEPVLIQIANGDTFDLDPTEIEALVLDYAAHAAFEEAEFLPLCRTILARTRDHVSMTDLAHKGSWAPTVPVPI
jgi:hemerythrin-like domain-containing protein